MRCSGSSYIASDWTFPMRPVNIPVEPYTHTSTNSGLDLVFLFFRWPYQKSCSGYEFCASSSKYINLALDYGGGDKHFLDDSSVLLD